MSNNIPIKAYMIMDEFLHYQKVPENLASEKYAQRMGLKNTTGLTFLFEGTRVYPTNTPEALNMQNGDEIEVTSNQIGG